MCIKAISFDADDTLWDWQTAMRHALRCTRDVMESHVPGVSERLSIDRLIAIRDEVAEDLEGSVTLA